MFDNPGEAQMDAGQRLDVLERQMSSLRAQVQRNEELLDTIASPLVKRMWWFLCGYRLWTVGRWY